MKPVPWEILPKPKVYEGLNISGTDIKIIPRSEYVRTSERDRKVRVVFYIDGPDQYLCDEILPECRYKRVVLLGEGLKRSYLDYVYHSLAIRSDGEVEMWGLTPESARVWSQFCNKQGTFKKEEWNKILLKRVLNMAMIERHYL